MDLTEKTQLKSGSNSWIGRSKILICGFVSALMILSASAAWAGCGKRPDPSGPGFGLWCRCKGGMTYENDKGVLDCKARGYSEGPAESDSTQTTTEEQEQQNSTEETKK
jgi:hypothetical protein